MQDFERREEGQRNMRRVTRTRRRPVLAPDLIDVGFPATGPLAAAGRRFAEEDDILRFARDDSLLRLMDEVLVAAGDFNSHVSDWSDQIKV